MEHVQSLRVFTGKAYRKAPQGRSPTPRMREQVSFWVLALRRLRRAGGPEAVGEAGSGQAAALAAVVVVQGAGVVVQGAAAVRGARPPRTRPGEPPEHSERYADDPS
jgi:hypothetical protein